MAATLTAPTASAAAATPESDAASSLAPSRARAVYIEEPSVEQAVSILRGIKSKYESHHGVTILDAAIVLAAKLAKRYVPSRRLPDSASA